MDRKDLLLKLCDNLAKAIDYLYDDENDINQAFVGEVLAVYGSLFINLGWVLTWGSDELKNNAFKIIEDAFKKKHLLRCRLEEYLRFKISNLVDEALNSPEEQKEEKTQKTQTDPDELPF